MSYAQWLGKESRRIAKRLVIKGELVLQTPAQFGSGDSDDLTDMALLVDTYDGISPLLPGATLAGALRSYLYSREQGYRQADAQGENTLTELLFGGFKRNDDGKQSLLIVDDTLGENYNVEMRDGVRLDPQTRTADDGGLFDMQVWAAGTTFPIRLELLLTAPKRKKNEPDAEYKKRQNGDFKKQKEALLTALQGLTDGGITLGGRKNRGLGRIHVKQWLVKEYDLTQASELMVWLKEGDKSLASGQCVDKLEEADAFSGIKPACDKREYFQMKATFKLEGSLLIRANGLPGSNSPDMVHLSDHNGRPVLPGTSIAGALRQRARRILHLIDPTPEKEDPTQKGEVVCTGHKWLTCLFGDEEMRDEFKASRLIVEETKIREPQFDLVQNRVAIDRFTGGALDTALFNEQPVFGRPETRLYINITIRQPKEHDIGLLLLLLKDLWTGDLPLGGEVGVGRGRLAGLTADLIYKQADKEETWGLREEANGQIEVKTESDRSLQSFVDALHGKEVADA